MEITSANMMRNNYGIHIPFLWMYSRSGNADTVTFLINGEYYAV